MRWDEDEQCWKLMYRRKVMCLGVGCVDLASKHLEQDTIGHISKYLIIKNCKCFHETMNFGFNFLNRRFCIHRSEDKSSVWRFHEDVIKCIGNIWGHQNWISSADIIFKFANSWTKIYNSRRFSQINCHDKIRNKYRMMWSNQLNCLNQQIPELQFRMKPKSFFLMWHRNNSTVW